MNRTWLVVVTGFSTELIIRCHEKLLSSSLPVSWVRAVQEGVGQATDGHGHGDLRVHSLRQRSGILPVRLHARVRRHRLIAEHALRENADDGRRERREHCFETLVQRVHRRPRLLRHNLREDGAANCNCDCNCPGRKNNDWWATNSTIRYKLLTDLQWQR